MDRAGEMTMFAEVVEAGSFSGAARALDLTPSAVSKQIRRLEDRLGVRLFYRTTRHLALTEAGEAFYEYAARIVRELAEAEQAVAAFGDHPRGKLRVAMTVSFGRVEVLPRVEAFLERYPEVKLEIELTDRQVDLVEEGIDLAIQWREQVEDPSVVSRRLCINRRIICAAPAYIERRGMPRTPEELLEHNCLTLSELSEFNDWEFEDEEHGSRVLHVGGDFSANTADALYEAALAGVGLARLSTWLVMPDIRAGRLVPVLPAYPHDRSAFYVVYAQRRHLLPAVRAFVDFLVELFVPVPPWEQEGVEFTPEELQQRIEQSP